MKRLTLFLLTNLLAVATLALVAGVVCVLCGVDLRALVASDRSGLTFLLAFSFLFGMAGAVISLLLSKPIAKASTGCRVVDGTEGEAERWLVETVGDLARRAGLKTPEVAVYPGRANAFATGAFRNSALVAVSSDIMGQMSREELRAVLAHEMSHVANGDMVTMGLTQGIVNTFVIFFSHVAAQIVQAALNGNKERRRGSFGLYYIILQLMQLVFGIFASLVVLRYSRRREYAADAGSARLLGSPAPMIAALRRLGNLQPGILPDSIKAFGIASPRTSVFSTHPALEDRIDALMNLKPEYVV